MKRKIYVRHRERISGDVGSVVVIFDESHDDTVRLSDDMARGAPERIGYGVLLDISVRSSGGAGDRARGVWRVPDDSAAAAHVRRLVRSRLRSRGDEGRAAVDGGSRLFGGKIVVYVAPKPPRSIFRSIADRMGHKILYVPLGQLSPTKLKKIRVVHVLDSHARRLEAKDYIW